jgi:nitronate monooxygenase
MLKTSFTKLVGIQWPIVQAPMIGGYSSPEMVAIVSNLGCLGTLALGNLSAEQVTQHCLQALALTDKPIAANLFAHSNQEFISETDKTPAIKALQTHYQQLDIDDSVLFNQTLTDLPDLDSQVEAIINTAVPIVSFTFGIPNRAIVKKLKQHGKIVIATATTIEEAKQIEQNDFDAVILQGIEAGGHRASFLSDGHSGPTSQSLLKQTQQAISIPIVITGGIMNGQHIAQHINNGAKACQLGTAFLFTNESKIEPFYLQALLQQQNKTCLSKAFTGKYARIINNKFAQQMVNKAIADFPYQGQLTSSLRSKATALAQYEYLPFWAGESYALGCLQSAEMLTKKLIKELQSAISTQK